jgi:protein tyrosine/serine phosphatase
MEQATTRPSRRRRLQAALKRKVGNARGASVAKARPAHWAQPIQLNGVNNLHRVTAQLYRSAQPRLDAMSELRTLGIRTVINLRAFHCDLPGLRASGLGHRRLQLFTWKIEDMHVIRVLSLLRDARHGPFLIHCKHGADRTGLMIAMYRMVEQGWSKRAALREMIDGGYGYHRLWRNIVRYIEQVDIERIRSRVRPGRPQA